MKDTGPGPEAMNDTGPDRARTERELRDALEALAGGVQPARPLPDAYRTARGEWLRRERRRRLVLAVLIAVVFALATLIGLWVLNQAPAHPGVIFSGTGDAVRGASLPRPHP
ncbi:hypothetical protein ABZ464_45830 [Streptomyces sp. NPDC005820]|uniref:hypothetical protein n=1 Tax=Streptomyces sp. NPDC005820 TaxID=3157069 RepID=UPI0033D4D1A5